MDKDTTYATIISAMWGCWLLGMAAGYLIGLG